MKTAVSTLVLTMFIAHGALAQDATIKQKQKPVPAKAASTSLPAAQKGGGAKSTAVKLGQPENKPLNTSTAQATVGSAAERSIEQPDSAYFVQRDPLNVFDRPRTDLDANGIRFGSFIAKPSVELGTEYNSNIFTSEQNVEADTIFKVSPTLDVKSDWNRNQLNFKAGLTSAAYRNNDEQDWTDALLAANGAIDITTGQYISGGFSFQRLHEERGFPNTASVVSNLGPTLYNVSAANIGYTRKVGQIGLSVAYDAVDYNYLDNENVRNDDRDRFDNIGTARVGYEFMRGYEVFARGSLSDRQYADFRDDNGFARGGEGYEAVLGADFRLTGTLSGDVYAGQASKSFDDIRFRDVDSFVYGSSLLWFPTQLTSIKFRVDRSIEDAVLSGASSYIQSDHFIRVEHELQRNFLVSANAGYSEFDFQGGVDREDKIYNAGVGGKYLVSRNVYIGGDYQLRQRNSDATFSDYQQQVVMATIGLRY
jgi:hypothetical protein